LQSFFSLFIFRPGTGPAWGRGGNFVKNFCGFIIFFVSSPIKIIRDIAEFAVMTVRPAQPERSMEVHDMLIKGTEGYLPIQKKAARPVSRAPAGRVRRQNGRYDHCTLSAEQTDRSFRDVAASLSYQVRTHNTTGKIQELRRAVSSGEYQVSARETAARMLLMEEGE